MSDFNWVPDFGMEQEVELRMNEAGFGDGYKQVSPDGLNPEENKFMVQFSREVAEIVAIDAFLRGKKGFSFTFTPVRRAELRVRCAKWKVREDKPGWATLSAEFIRAYT